MLVLIALLQSVHAYETTSAPWPAGLKDITLHSSPNMASKYPSRWDALQDAAELISNTAAECTMTVVADNDYDQSSSNWESEVYFTTSTAILCDSPTDCAIAFMDPYAVGGVVRVEADVVFDGGFNWGFTDDKDDSVAYTSGAARPLLNTALHELLHAMGLSHEDSVYNVMGNAWNVVNTNGQYTDTYVGEDATQGLIDLFWAKEEYEDLALSHWKWLAADPDGYSNHTRTIVTDSLGGSLSTASISAAGDTDKRYEVGVGDTVLVELTLENNGLTSQEVLLEFFLSTDDNVRPSDQSIGSTWVILGPNEPWTNSFSVTLPAGVAGERWIGAKVDATQLVDEVYDNNNSVYVAALDIQ